MIRHHLTLPMIARRRGLIGTPRGSIMECVVTRSNGIHVCVFQILPTSTDEEMVAAAHKTLRSLDSDYAGNTIWAR
jgi:hypothetical protein|tara:strand:+ start:79 stop:306 length:228 start_codon:yes stop_codon:yes gene_type:complete